MSDTRHERASQSGRVAEARWRAVIDSAVDGIVVIDSKGLIEAFNPAAQQLFGCTEEEVLGAFPPRSAQRSSVHSRRPKPEGPS